MDDGCEQIEQGGLEDLIEQGGAEWRVIGCVEDFVGVVWGEEIEKQVSSDEDFS